MDNSVANGAYLLKRVGTVEAERLWSFDSLTAGHRARQEKKHFQSLMLQQSSELSFTYDENGARHPKIVVGEAWLLF